MPVIQLTRADLLSLYMCASQRAEDLAIQITCEHAAQRSALPLEAAAEEATRVARKVRAVLEMNPNGVLA